jgi:hypothetical protein
MGRLSHDVGQHSRAMHSKGTKAQQQQELTSVRLESPFSSFYHMEQEYPQKPSVAPMQLLPALSCVESFCKQHNNNTKISHQKQSSPTHKA